MTEFSRSPIGSSSGTDIQNALLSESKMPVFEISTELSKIKVSFLEGLLFFDPIGLPGLREIAGSLGFFLRLLGVIVNSDVDSFKSSIVKESRESFFGNRCFLESLGGLPRFCFKGGSLAFGDL